MYFNIDLNDQNDFTSFWDIIADREETNLEELLDSFGFEVCELIDISDDDEPIISWKPIIDGYFLTQYHIWYDDSHDRAGPSSMRLAARLKDFVTVEDVRNIKTLQNQKQQIEYKIYKRIPPSPEEYELLETVEATLSTKFGM